MFRTGIRWLALVSLLSCKSGGDAPRSYCEAVCDWAVACHATERTIDEAARTQSCLDATRAADASCEEAESGSLDPASKELLDKCVQAVDDAAAAGECTPFVGSIDEIKAATAPEACATQGADAQGTFDAARNATQETGEELCQRFTETFCLKAEECILGDFAGQIPDEAIQALGGTPAELCVQRLDPVFTAECLSSDLYGAEQDITEANPPRQGARECLRDFSELACEDIFSGQMPETCAASFTTAEEALAFAQVLLTLSEDFAEYAQ